METLAELLETAGIQFKISKNREIILGKSNDIRCQQDDHCDIFRIYPKTLNSVLICTSAGEAYEDIKRLLTLK